MSLASLGNNYALRAVAPDVQEVQGAAAAGVPQNAFDALARWIPTETLTLYAGLVAVLNTTLSTNESLAVLLICIFADVVYVWTIAVHKVVATVREGQTFFSEFPKHVPGWEIGLSVASFVFWVSAIPGSWPTHWSFWDQRYGLAGVVLAAAAIPFLAAQLNLSPPSAQLKK